ncbi:MAG: glyoxalase superfamily protein [Aquisalimonadaceae bacterium]
MRLSFRSFLRIFDEAKAKEFYVGFLVSEHHGDSCPGSALRIETDEIEPFHQQLVAAEYKYAKPALENTPWGSKDMSVADPFGNKLIFTNAIST